MKIADPKTDAAINLAKEALARRADLSGAGQAIMRSFGLNEKQARELHKAEVARRKAA